MQSVADDLRLEARAALLLLSPAERVTLALRLGDDDIQLLAAARGVPIEIAVALARKAHSAGRRPCACTEGPTS